MIGKKDTKDSIDTKRLNEVIKISKNVLQIIHIVAIVALVVLATYLLKHWGVLSFFIVILKILSPLFIGIIIAWLLNPIVSWLTKKGVNRTLSTVSVFIVFLSILVLLLYLVIPAFMNQIKDIITVVPELIDNADNWIQRFFDNLTNLYEYDFASIEKEVYQVIKNFSETITVGLPDLLVSLAGTIISGGINILMGFILAFYLLFDLSNVRKHFLTFVPKKFHHDAIEITDRLDDTLKSYVQGTLFVMFVLFVFQSTAFSVAGLKAPLVFGTFCAITNIIPYIGPYLGGIPAVLVGFTISPLVGLFTLIAVLCSQLLESYVLTPIIMSKTMKLHPVTIIIGLLIFGHFFGMLGMILSTPVISCVKVIVNFFDEKFEIFEMIKN